MGSSASKFSPYLYTFALQFEAPVSGEFRRDNALCQEFYSDFVPPPGILRQEFTVSTGATVSGVFRQELNVSSISFLSALGQEFSISEIDTGSVLGQESNVEAIDGQLSFLNQQFSVAATTSGILGQEFSGNILADNSLGQEFDANSIQTSSAVQQEVVVSSINFAGGFSQEFAVASVVSGSLGQEFNIGASGEAALSQEFELGTISAADSFNQEFNIVVINNASFLSQEASIVQLSSVALGQEFVKGFAGESSFGQEFVGFQGVSLGQEFKIPVEQLPDNYPRVDGTIQFFEEEQEYSIEGLSIEGQVADQLPKAGQERIVVSISSITGNEPVDSVTFSYRLSERDEEIFSTNGGVYSHEFTLPRKLKAGDVITYSVYAYVYGFNNEVIQFFPTIGTGDGLVDSVSSTLIVTGQPTLPALVTIHYGAKNNLPRILSFYENEQGKLQGTYLTVNSTDLTVTTDLSIVVGNVVSLNLENIDSDTVSKNGLTLVQKKSKNNGEQIALLKNTGV